MTGGLSATDAFPQLGACADHGPAVGAHVVLRDDAGRLLCQLRDAAAGDRPAGWRHPGRWGLFGGAVEPGETVRECALRELAEETGLALDPARLRPLCRIVLASAPARPLLYVFSARTAARPADVRLGEGAGFAFLTLAQARGMAFIPEHLRAMEAASA